MKSKLTSKIMLILMTFIMALTLFQGFSFAENNNMQMIKKSNTEYMIYISDLLEENFEFAFSNSKETEKDMLEFKDSAKDQLENGKNIAYVDEEMYNKYFKDQKETFIWAKQKDTYKLEAQAINIAEALTEEEIQDLNKITKKIVVEFGKKELPEEVDKDGVKITRKIGTVEIKDSEDYKYEYILMKSETGKDTAKLIALAEEMNQLKDKNMYDKLAVYKEFKTIYEKLEPAINNTKWAEVNGNIIDQPIESKENDQYLVWIKKYNKDENIVDLQIMTCLDENTPKYEDKEVVVKKTTKLPITGDNIALFVVAGIILFLIIVLVVLKLKNNNKQDNKDVEKEEKKIDNEK